ncbi:LysE family translocator [Aliikangiella maris]|uniref:LysE family transporter n=2 Tax=Aliikangiella maris TaxID=3162458 RepID=A0ABV2BYQ2_9GAMM
MLNEFLLLTIAHIIAVASPGADFAVVLRNTLSAGKKAGVVTAIGIGCGISVHIVYTVLGVAVVLSQSEMLFNGIKIIGAIYLLWLAWQALQSRAKRAAKNYQPQSVSLKNHQAFYQGFLTNVFNPKATVFFLALFTSIVSQTTPWWIQSLYGLWLVVYIMLWFVVVAWVFSRKKVLDWYQTHGHYFDWGMGIFLIFIAFKLFLG